MCDDEDVIYIDGERKYLVFSVMSNIRRENDAVVISEASYVLEDSETGKTAASGKCEVKDRKIMILLSPPPGLYKLTLTAVIPPETIKHRAYICVEK